MTFVEVEFGHSKSTLKITQKISVRMENLRNGFLTTGPISLFWLKLSNTTKLQNTFHVMIDAIAFVCFERFEGKLRGKICKILSWRIMRIIFICLMLAQEAALLLYK